MDADNVAPAIDVTAVEQPSSLPASYKADILAMLRVYLRDPTNIRAAGVSGIMHAAGRSRRQIVCLQFDAKTSSGEYSGLRERIAIFSKGKLEQMAEAAPNQCASAVYEPFPEAERLSR
jgi:site-specific recombinase XerC